MEKHDPFTKTISVPMGGAVAIVRIPVMVSRMQAAAIYQRVKHAFGGAAEGRLMPLLLVGGMTLEILDSEPKYHPLYDSWAREAE